MRRLERSAGVLSLLAGGIHGIASPEHFGLWWGYGLFFLAATIAQVLFGLLLITQGIEARGGWAAVRGKVYVAGILGNLAIIALWVVTRTTGIPLGPEAGEVEAVGVLDATSKVLEIALLACLAWLLATQGKAAAVASPQAP